MPWGSRSDPDTTMGGPHGQFPSTQLSLLEAASSGAALPNEALERVSVLYWKPVYRFIRVKFRKNNEDAKDLTQSFFATALQRDFFARFDPAKASFRTYVRMAVERFAASQHAAENRQKRGGAPKAGVDTSQQPCDFNVYSGPSAESEPETQNLAGLMRTASISFYADVHSYGRDILYPWGIETDQTKDTAQSFENRAKDGQRDGNQASAYAEYIPAGQLAALQAMAKRMCDFIYTKAGGADPTAQARSVYKPAESAVLYPTKVTTGCFDDYCFSRWFTQATAGTPISPVMAFTIEAGGDPKLGADHDEGGFAPDYVNHYPKIEREIHAALWGFLTAVAATNVQPPSPPPQPSPPAPAPSASSGNCFIAGAAYRDAGHPDVQFLRDVRDRQ